jgi:hypothetical protein
MGSSIEHQEMSSGQEAKVISSQPTASGASLHAKDFLTPRPPILIARRELSIGRYEGEDKYLKFKDEARASSEAPRAPELLQADVQSTKAAAIFSTAKLPANFAGLDDTGWAPPDCSLAAGPSHLIIAINSAWALLDKAGHPILRCEFSDWFSNVVVDAIILNPKVIFDQYAGRWVITACAWSSDGEHSWFLVSVSQARNPLGPWWNWAFDASLDGEQPTPYRADALALGVDNAALYLTANMFDRQGAFQYAKLRILSKRELYAGGTARWRDFCNLRNPDGSPVFGLQPAHTFGAPGIEYLLNTTSDGRSLTQWSLANPLSPKPQLTRRAISTVPYQLAPFARQPETTREIDTGDTRLANVVFRNGLLSTAHTVAANWGDAENVSAVQWFQINPGAGTLPQQHIYGARGFHYFCPTMMVDGQSNLIMVFNRVGKTEFPSIRFTGRLSTDTPNTLQASARIKESRTAGPTAWGHYNGAAVDPNDTKVWVVGQYAATESEWATWIGETSYIASSAEGNSKTVARS